MDKVQYINNTKSHLNGVRYIIDDNKDHRLFVSDLVEIFGRSFLDLPRVKRVITKRRIAGQTRRLILKRVFEPVMVTLIGDASDITAGNNKFKPCNKICKKAK